MRLDKWIWAVRMVKTRALGAELCRGGHVLVNEERAKPSRALRLGDRVEVRQRETVKVYRLIKSTERRLSAKEAAECYEDISPPPPQEKQKLLAPAGERERGSGRPTKRDRRAIARLRREYF